ncbi:unnamed protein product, partial [Prorocentrum cordatum]
VSAPPSDPGLGFGDGGTGLTQDTAHLILDNSDVAIGEAAGQPSGQPAGAVQAPLEGPAVMLNLQLLQAFVEAEIVQHFALIQAVSATTSPMTEVAVAFPRSWVELQALLGRLAYDVQAVDPWRRLGLPMYEGLEPTASVIAARARSARYFRGLAAVAAWAPADPPAVAVFVAA